MNTNLHKAKKAKNDEFYTQYEDIEKELSHYTDHFKDKIVYCNCDDPKFSNFWKYFVDNFERLGLKKLVATYYKEGEAVYKSEYFGYRIPIIKTELLCDGDFRSRECIDVLKEGDVVVTNPPFSLFREYVGQLMEYGKKFLIVGSDNAITYKDFFPHIKANEVWKGVTHPKEFTQPDGSTKKFGNISWFTNLGHTNRHDFIPLTAHYAPEKYPKFDNYDAINVDKTKDIPCDYYGVMGVPISFLDKYNPEQFEIVAFRKGENGQDLVFTRGGSKSSTLLSYPCTTSIPGMIKNAEGKINGKITYARITIRKKK